MSRIESLRREIEILRCVNHPCIIKLYDVYEDDRFIHLVTELCTGGELFDRIIQKTESEEGHYSEKDAKVCVWGGERGRNCKRMCVCMRVCVLV